MTCSGSANSLDGCFSPSNKPCKKSVKYFKNYYFMMLCTGCIKITFASLKLHCFESAIAWT